MTMALSGLFANIYLVVKKCLETSFVLKLKRSQLEVNQLLREVLNQTKKTKLYWDPQFKICDKSAMRFVVMNGQIFNQNLVLKFY